MQQTVSASRLSLYLSCRLKFFFRYVAKLKKPKPAALHVGGAVHATLKAWNKARWRGEILTLKQLHEEFVKAWADTEGEPVEWDGEEADRNRPRAGVCSTPTSARNRFRRSRKRWRCRWKPT